MIDLHKYHRCMSEANRLAALSHKKTQQAYSALGLDELADWQQSIIDHHKSQYEHHIKELREFAE
jgi:hypothetical protein